MYRDAKAALDERDRAVGAILIAEALIATCERARVLGRAAGPEAWRAIRDAHDDFPEIWRSLDRARHVLAQRGLNVMGYDELRPKARTRLASENAETDDVDAVRVDPAALDDARRGANELKLAVPGADWAAIERRTSGLVHAPLIHRRRHHLAMAGAFVLFGLVALSWASAMVPHKKPERTDDLHRELVDIAQQRRIKIGEMQRAIGERCDPPVAHELTRQLVMDGRGLEARSFAAGYVARCGDDAVVLHWANAPLP
jgi:hypothetical protein